MDLPKPPEDQELRNIIDKLAQFVARNGREFERMTRSKQQSNPKFAFLFGGEFFNYYQYKVTTEQASFFLVQKLKQKSLDLAQQQLSIQAATAAVWQSHLQIQRQQELQDQIKESERNLAAQHDVLLQKQQIQVDEAIRLAQEERLQNAAREAGIELSVADKIMQPIIDSCTKDSISVGKSWIFNNAVSTEACQVIANYLVKRITALGTTFDLKLHLVYLINDVLHHCVRRKASELKKVLGTVVVPIFCTTSIGASEERQLKLSKLLRLWESNKYFLPEVIEQLKSPTTSMSSYQAGLVAEYAAQLAPITTSIQSQYAALQKQHQDFVTHINSQLQALAAQALKAQQLMAQQQQQMAQQQQQQMAQQQQQQMAQQQQQQSKLMQQFLPAQTPPTQPQQPPQPGRVTPPSQSQPLPTPQPTHQQPQQSLLNPLEVPMPDSPLPRHPPPVVTTPTVVAAASSSQPLPGPNQQSQPPVQQQMSPQTSPIFPHVTGNTSIGIPLSETEITTPLQLNATAAPPLAESTPLEMARSVSPGEQVSSTAAAAETTGNGNNSNNIGPGHLNYNQLPPGFVPNFAQPPPPFAQPPPGFHPNFGPPNYYHMQSGGLPFCPKIPMDDSDAPPRLIPGLGLPDLSKPPPGFPGPMVPQSQPVLTAAEQLQNQENITPNVPYFELPAGLMTNLVKLEDCEYKPLRPEDIVLPPPQAPSDRLLAAVELFYAPPSHDRPRNSVDGWEQLGLYEFFKAKSQAKKRKDEDIAEGRRARSPRSKSRSRSRERQIRDPHQWSPSPPRRKYREEIEDVKSAFYNRHKSKSRSRSRSKSKSKSPAPIQRPSKSKSKSRSPGSPTSHGSPSKRRSASKSPTPPSFFAGNYSKGIPDSRLDESNKGHQLLKKMGWSGAGLGVSEQGIQEPISGGDVRDRQDQYKGIGINLNDPFESFRKSKGQAFINRIRARAEEHLNHQT